ncbi:VOC family protein [Acuticoccus kandeliae]|uniref:VOC family protein n=1 Tax=Acuticoccus kandeliae TaxID=2073160 RepID=UPI000D3E0954|nr:VOC family protein [Acuticoccus kandeliae]
MASIQHHVWPGCSTVSAFIVSAKAREALEFAKAAFGAESLDEPLLRADGSLAHAAIKIGDSTIMLGDPRDPQKEHPAFLHIYVPDCDATYEKAVAAGAQGLVPPSDHFYGDRGGGVVDPAGNTWWIATHVRTLSRAEIRRLAEEEEART